MTNEIDRIEREIKTLERELELPISTDRRINIMRAISHLKDKKRHVFRVRA